MVKKQKLQLDKWQQDILNTKGNICVCSGRQIGKSTVISIDAAEFAIKNKNSNILMIAAVERQAQELFQKTLWYLQDNYSSYIKKGKDKPTQSIVKLGNGSVIRCLPTGIDGHGIRGFTVDRLYADEAHYISELVWDAITPMLLTTGGDIILLSTPRGDEGYFYDAFHDKSFSKFHISSEQVIKDRPITDSWTEVQRDKGLEYLKREKDRKTELVYAQEYLGKFVSGLMQFFPSGLIEKVMTVKQGAFELAPQVNNGRHSLFMGVDVARMGNDETVLASLKRDSNTKKLSQFDMEITTKTLTTDTVRLIKFKDREFDYKRIYIDDGGLGVGVFDPLLEDSQTKRKVVAINNASRSIDMGTRRKKLLKEDLYFNLKNLMEKGEIDLFDKAEIAQSLKSVQYEYNVDGSIRIYGKYTHIVEALIRAAWCIKDAKLEPYIN